MKKGYKFNSNNLPVFVHEQEFTTGVPMWIVTISGNDIRIFNGDFLVTENDAVIQYIPAASASLPDFQDYKDIIGKQLLTTIWKTLNATGLTDAVKASILQTIVNVQIACLAGEIRVARDIANATATTANFTAARKTALLGLIDTAISEQL